MTNAVSSNLRSHFNVLPWQFCVMLSLLFSFPQIQVLIEILAIPHEEFQSRWCSTDIPMEEDINLEYDPFTAAGVALLFLSPDCDSALSAPVPPNEINFGCHSNFNGAMSLLTYAQQKASYLVKIIANLHCFIPNICEGDAFFFILMQIPFYLFLIFYPYFLINYFTMNRGREEFISQQVS